MKQPRHVSYRKSGSLGLRGGGGGPGNETGVGGFAGASGER